MENVEAQPEIENTGDPFDTLATSADAIMEGVDALQRIAAVLWSRRMRRDYFAAAALTGLLSHRRENSPAHTAQQARKFGDALLIELDGTEDLIRGGV